MKIIIDLLLPLDIGKLKNENVPVAEVSNITSLLTKIDNELKRRNLHWLTFSTSEWKKSSIQHANPNLWVQQFAELGYGEIGKNLLKNLRVVPEGELREAFKISKAENIGLHIAHAYIHDPEAGSSSIAIKKVLDHLYLAQNVINIDLAKPESLALQEIDVLCIYEDGLWSGVELVKRLNAICDTEHFKNSHLQIYFKYSVTCDVGLAAARLCAKRKGKGRIQFQPAKSSHHLTFFKDGFDAHLKNLMGKSDDEIRRALDAEIEPYAFRPDAKWGQNREDAISVCTQIGEQLIKPFLQRREKEKMGKDQVHVTPESIEISAEKIKRWGLGALNFASTVVFDSSIPKPVLPLMWLKGPVTLGGKTIDWKPLFWDSRRIGEAGNEPIPVP